MVQYRLDRQGKGWNKGMTKKKKTAPVKKNKSYIVTCTDLTHEGNGVAKVDGYPLFVPYLLPGEKAKVKVVKVNKHFGYGKLIKLLNQSQDRVEAPCTVFYRCGGCQLQHMSYEAQLEMKQEKVQNQLKRIGHITEAEVHPTLGMVEPPWHYRNKIQMPVGEKDGSLITGFYRERSHDIIPDMETCLIQNKTGDTIIQNLRQIADELGIPAYDEINHRGVLRHFVVRTAYHSKDTMLIIVTRTNTLPHEKELVERITSLHPEIQSVIHNINNRRTNVIFGDRMRTIYGENYIVDRIGSIRYRLSPRSFFQVNPIQTKRLYETALEYAQVDEDDIVIDAYCGIGSISLFLAQKAKKVYGVEVVAEAVEDAKRNAKLNELDNVEFVVGKAEDVMPRWKTQGIKPDVIVVDPPRKGCDKTLLQTMLDMEPKRIVYVSCNPATLARDLRILEDGGYRTMEVQPVDMFSQTHHVEAVALMSRVDE